MLTDQNSLYMPLQIGVLALFGIALYRSARLGRARLLELVTAVVFGLLLEEGDILIFGTYRYNEHWFLIDQVPVAIALCWALIVFSAMNLTDALGIDERIAPLADALWAILLDISLDAVAIRLGMWRWTIGLNAGWFGVPWSNFYSWLGVVASFSFFARWVRQRDTRQLLWQCLAPIVSYVGLLLTILPYSILANMYFRRAGVEWLLFAIPFAAIVMITLAGIVRDNVPRDSPDRFLATVRYLIHAYFLWALVGAGIAGQLPILLYVSVAMLGVETLLVIYLSRAFRRRAIALAS
jgi:carotenoid biosynthesis protein